MDLLDIVAFGFICTVSGFALGAWAMNRIWEATNVSRELEERLRRHGLL